ncbi:hypothetical protein CEUSTIGMA_g11057.t1 [Chlamydomonas eustigma]|uniref:Uncharacterized protein n=1 Tax=Chlamydomonas eustigma TaxID=1157962 RepID=A0A250XKT0_9CHLO|nr:hypothetical protein CEUSTIGMA_g11057.t1 [Chlamydomonas eustigma]|eukprot:GAX83633.1 hypothetical protein CEUSTIGMA_g11057.t1 [Chlamydomonas eustigma]
MSTSDIAKRLAFQDLSITLNRIPDANFDSLKAKVVNIRRSHDANCQSMKTRSLDLHEKTKKQASEIGQNRLILKRQLQGLKSSLLNLGQKEFFSEAILKFSEHHDYKSEAERSSAALESAEEDLKDMKKANQQDEEQLLEAIQMIESYQEQFTQTSTRLAAKMEEADKSMSELEVVQTAPPLSPLPASSHEDMEVLLAREALQAMTLEADLARMEASCRDLEGDVKSNEAEIAHMEADINRLEALKQDEAKLTEERYEGALTWTSTVMDILKRSTGVSISSIAEDSICLKINGVVAAEPYQLTAYLKPGTSILQKAVLEPTISGIDMPLLVKYVEEVSGGLPLLLTLVRGAALGLLS